LGSRQVVKDALVGNSPWLEIRLGWKVALLGWKFALVGKSPCLVGSSPAWLEIRLGWKVALLGWKVALVVRKTSSNWPARVLQTVLSMHAVGVSLHSKDQFSWPTQGVETETVHTHACFYIVLSGMHVCTMLACCARAWPRVSFVKH
jgi:hypothetical protein